MVQNFLPNASVRNKLTLVIMACSLFILLLVSGTYVAVEIHTTRTALVRETATLAGSLAENCRQLLLLNKYTEAEQVLASLKLQPNIHAAYLFDDSGKPVAEYLSSLNSHFLLEQIENDFVDQNRAYWSGATNQNLLFDWQHLGLFLPVLQGEQYLGSLYLLSDMQGLYGRLSGVGVGVLLALGLLLLLSWLLSGQLQKPVLTPLLSLVGTMGLISTQKDYSLRAQKRGRDEIGLLVDGFNQMLDEIEQHRRQLEEHQDSLEKTVLQRTSELRQTVAQLDQARQQAEAASEAKSQFLANMTHELRTPLIGVLGMNELLFRTAMSEQQEMLAKTVQKSGEDLLRLINDVLDFSRIEAGKLRLETEEVKLYQVLEDAVNLLWPRAHEKGLKLTADIPLQTAWTVRGDEKRLQQIIINLLGNAIKFTAAGEVRVRLRLLSQQDHQGRFRIEVEDTGIGMDAAAQRQIFSAFYQADGTTTREYGGTGLGLGIVRQLVELMQGEIVLESAPQQGSCFQVQLKLPLVAPGDFSLPAQLRQQKVLIQEDDPVTRQLLLQRLTDLSLRPVESVSSHDAWYQLTAAQRSGHPFAMMILSADACLPDGQRLLEAVRGHETASNLRRILLLSSQAESVHPLAQETRLYRPLGWAKLTEALNKSWHELHLVQVPTASDKPATKKARADQSTKSLALVGVGVASRELIRMALRSSEYAVEVVASLEQLIEEQTDRRYSAVVLDLAAIELDKLARLLKVQPLSNLILLHQADDQVELLRPLVAGLLEKPFHSKALLELLAQRAEVQTVGQEGI